MTTASSWPDSSTLIPDLLSRLPRARTVVDRYGLRGCGGEQGPVETLGLWLPFVLINTGCTLRVVGQTLSDFSPRAFAIAGVSGLFEVTGLAIWGVHLWRIMSARARPDAHEHECDAVAIPDGEISRRSTVAGLLDRDPELIDTFVAYGFKMLSNSRLRRSIARVVTIEQACRRMDVNPDQFIADLNQKKTEDEAMAETNRQKAEDGSGTERKSDCGTHDCCRHECTQRFSP
jgi:hypothetical protein